MTDPVAILKDEEREWPVPSAWRQTLREIVGAIKDRNYSLTGIARVEQLDHASANAIAKSIHAYGETISALPDESWDTSVCQWQLTYWELLVDLFTIEGGRSDLVLHVNVIEEKKDFLFKVHFVYVP